MLSPVLVTPPATTPVSLAEAKTHLRVDGDDDDALITALIEAATEAVELDLGRKLVTQTWRADMGGFWGADYRLPMRPVQSIASVEYWDSVSFITVDDASYTLFADAFGAFGLDWAPGYSLPGVSARSDAVRVTFVAGYGDPEVVPAPVKQRILLEIASLNARRASTSDAPFHSHPSASWLTGGYWVPRC